MSNEKNHAEQQARAQYESICSMVAALECDYDRLEELREQNDDQALAEDDAAELAELEEAAGDCADADEARERIQEDALSVEVRSGWQSPGETLEPSEFCILLCTGSRRAHRGRAVRAWRAITRQT